MELLERKNHRHPRLGLRTGTPVHDYGVNVHRPFLGSESRRLGAVERTQGHHVPPPSFRTFDDTHTPLPHCFPRPLPLSSPYLSDSTLLSLVPPRTPVTVNAVGNPRPSPSFYTLFGSTKDHIPRVSPTDSATEPPDPSTPNRDLCFSGTDRSLRKKNTGISPSLRRINFLYVKSRSNRSRCRLETPVVEVVEVFW